MTSSSIRSLDGTSPARNLGKGNGTSHFISPGLVDTFPMRSSVFLNECIADEGTGPLSPSCARLHKVRPAVQHLQNTCVPTSALSPRPHVHPTSSRRVGRHIVSQGEGVTSEVDGDNDALQDWNERASMYFEWIGMVNLGAQRYIYFLTYLVGVID
jgi:hypothetical protein